ncbi:MAG: hypothetical protein J5817_02325 [Treponema sp.]|nr:hypothetical protein [Treponema sp.]
MMKKIMPLAVLANICLCAASLFLTGCKKNQVLGERSIYFWKSNLKLDQEEKTFVKKHNVKKIYAKFFDVVESNNGKTDEYGLTPIATLRFEDELPKDVQIVPVVFISENCLDGYNKFYFKYNLPKLLSYRVLQMCETHDIPVKEVQVDFDWTETNREDYYEMLEALRKILSEKNVSLSVTVRLHQLRMEEPPCDSGVLMLYNTGNFRDINCKNSILSYEDASPYIKNLSSYKLPLRLAFPNFSWYLCFKGNEFAAIAYDVDTGDKKSFKDEGDGKFSVLKETYLKGCSLSEGDTVRYVKADFEEISKVLEEIKQVNKDLASNNILFDLNSRNLKNLGGSEYEKIFN